MISLSGKYSLRIYVNDGPKTYNICPVAHASPPVPEVRILTHLAPVQLTHYCSWGKHTPKEILKSKLHTASPDIGGGGWWWFWVAYENALTIKLLDLVQQA